MEERMDTLSAENVRLGRIVRRIVTTGTLFIAVVAAVLLTGAGSQDIRDDIRARSVVIEDEYGRERIYLGFNTVGAAIIQLRANQGDVQMQIVSTADGETSNICIWDVNKNEKAKIYVDRREQGIVINNSFIRR